MRLFIKRFRAHVQPLNAFLYLGNFLHIMVLARKEYIYIGSCSTFFIGKFFLYMDHPNAHL